MHGSVSSFPKSWVFATISTGSQPSIHEASLADYKGAQAVGMGKEAQNVPSAAVLYKKANEILGFDLLDVCINGPKEKLNSTVISQFVVEKGKRESSLHRESSASGHCSAIYNLPPVSKQLIAASKNIIATPR
ncbi:[acyl-carrier-protein] S-malonyltransferase [Trifolium repens]|nr:[acyl-carrier-protein] S-malonyltransferase [Trifolium repens]